MPRVKSALGSALALWLFAATQAAGSAYVPGDDSIVLERVPAAAAARKLEPLRRKLSARPDDLPIALDLARGYLEIGRDTSDPRFVSYAYAALTPWLDRGNPPAAALVLGATALQNLHRFDHAVTMLDRALVIEPHNAQAWLTKATVLEVQGNFPAAHDACRGLMRSADQLIALTCILGVESRTGRLASSYQRLQRLVELGPQTDEHVRAWMLGRLGDMAERLGDFDAAKVHLEAATRAAPEDVYAKAAYADLLLRQGRAHDVIRLLDGTESHDNLLLRLAIAGEQLHSADAARWIEMYDARRRAARPEDNPHAREHARFLLEVRNAPQEALAMAEQNWHVQREPADIRVYLQAAQRAHRPQAAAPVHEWIHQTDYEDRTLESLAKDAARSSR